MMKLKNLILCGCISLLPGLSLNAGAVIVDGTFKGAVAEFNDLGDIDSSANDIWEGNIIGHSITGNFWYDTELAPGNNSNTPNEAIYFSRTNSWIGLTFTIDGKTFDISNYRPDNLALTESVEVATLEDHVPAVNGDNTESFALNDEIFLGESGGNYRETYGFLSFFDSTHDVLNGIGLVQEFLWKNTHESPVAGTAYFNTNGIFDGKSTFADATIIISEVSASIRHEASVPESSSFILFAIALSSLFFTRYYLHNEQ